MKKQHSLYRIVNFLALVLVICIPEVSAKTSQEQIAEDMMYIPLTESLPDIDDSHRMEVIGILNEVAEGRLRKIGRTIVSPRRAQIALLRIGDEATLQQVVEQFRSYDSRYAWDGLPKAMEYARQPKLIPYLSEDFFRDEDPAKVLRSRPQLLNPKASGTPSEATIVVPPRSVYAGTIAMRIVMKSPSFTPELQEWADSMIDMRINDPNSFQKSLRGWWIANEEHFENENYELVTSEIAEPEEPQVEPQPIEQPEKKPPTVEQPVEKTVPEEVSIEESEEPADSQDHSLLVGVAAIVVCVILIVLARSSSRGRAS